MTSTLATFELFAELSLALAGFSGVASTFGGRGREFSPIDRQRLDSIFFFSGLSLAVSLLVMTLADAGFSDARTYSFACGISGFLMLGVVSTQGPKMLKLRREGESISSDGFIAFSFVYLSGLSAAYFWAAIFEQASWPLLAGISSQLLYGLWMFARLLVRSR